jgi:integrase
VKRAVRWQLLDREPITKWPFFKETAFHRNRFLDEDEIKRLLAACENSKCQFLTPFVVLALNTGMRRSEILGLSNRSIDWKNRMATLDDTKNGETRYVPLNETAMEALRSLPESEDGRLFPFDDDHSIGRAFRRATARVGITDFRLHDLRHTFASYHAMAGIQGRGLQTLLGHKDPRMTLRYTHLSDTYIRAAVNAVNLGRSSRPALKNDTYLAAAPERS